MATTLSVFTDSQVRIKHRELYVSEGLNAKQAINAPKGVYQGFRLTTNVANNTITIQGATESNPNNVAVYLNSDGFALTLTNDSVSFPLDLSTLVDAVQRTWVIALYADYTIGQPTFAEIRAYQVSPVDELTGEPEEGEIIRLGEVTIPAVSAAPIAASNITMRGRTQAWTNQASEARLWSPLIRNGGFEHGVPDDSNEFSTAYWKKSYTGGVFSIETRTSDPASGSQSLFFDWTSGAGNGSATQVINVPVASGQLIRTILKKKTLSISTLGTLVLNINFTDELGASVGVLSNDVESTTIDGDYVVIDIMQEAPVGAVLLESVSITAVNLTLGLAGIATQFDDIQLWLEPFEVNPALFEDRIGDSHIEDLFLHDIAGLSSSKAAHLNYDGIVLNVGPRDPGDIVDVNLEDNLEVGRTLTVGADLLGSAASAADPRVIIPPRSSTTEFTCIWQANDLRCFVNDDGRLSFTSNADWTGTQWVKDDAGATAFELRLDKDKFRSYGVDTVTNNYADVAWIESAQFNLPIATASNILSLGAGLVSSDVANDIPRLKMAGGTSTRTLLWEIAGVSANVRFYIANVDPFAITRDSLEITVNAKWTNSSGLWVNDSAPAQRASRFALTQGDFVVEGNSSVSTWDDTEWTEQMRYDVSLGNLSVANNLIAGQDITAGDDIFATEDISAGDAVVAGTSDTDSGYFFTQRNFNSAYDGGTGLSAQNNNGRLYKNNMVKAWALVWVDGNQIDSPALPTLRLLDAFGISGLSTPDASTIRFSFPISYDTRSVNGQTVFGYQVILDVSAVDAGNVDNGGDGAFWAKVKGKGPGTIDVGFFNTSGSSFSMVADDYLLRMVMFGAEP